MAISLVSQFEVAEPIFAHELPEGVQLTEAMGLHIFPWYLENCSTPTSSYAIALERMIDGRKAIVQIKLQPAEVDKILAAESLGEKILAAARRLAECPSWDAFINGAAIVGHEAQG